MAPDSLKGCTTFRSCLHRTEPLPGGGGGTLFLMPPTEMGKGRHGDTLPPAVWLQVPLEKALGLMGTHTHPVWAVSPAAVPRGDPRVRSPPRSWGGEERPGWGEGPAGAAGETERRRRVGLPSRRAKKGGTTGPQPQLRLLGAERRGGGTLRGATGGEPRGEGRLQGTQRGLISPQLPGGQKCPFRRSPELKSRQKRPSEVILLAGAY